MRVQIFMIGKTGAQWSMKQATSLNFTQTQQTLFIHILTKLQLQTYANMKMAVTYSGQLKLKKISKLSWQQCIYLSIHWWINSCLKRVMKNFKSQLSLMGGHSRKHHFCNIFQMNIAHKANILRTCRGTKSLSGLKFYSSVF